MTEWEEVKAYLNNCRDIALLVHDKPDGDCLGSGLALGLGLKGIGFKPLMYLSEPLPELYRFLPGQDMIRIGPPETIVPGAVIIAVDCGDENRYKTIIPPGSQVINIDHHASNTNFGDLNIVDPSAAAAGEIIYRLFIEGKIEISPDIATCLYIALATDTGSFRFSNMTRNTFAIAGDLVELGAHLDLIRNKLYETRPFDELLTIKAALKTLFRSQDGKLMTCTLPYSDLKNDNLFTAETDGITNMMKSVEGVEVAMLFKELKPDEVKVSFRSKVYFDVNDLAQVFKGGGHPRAAGCTIYDSLDKAYSLVTAEFQRRMEG